MSPILARPTPGGLRETGRQPRSLALLPAKAGHTQCHPTPSFTGENQKQRTQLASNLVHALGRVLAVFTPEDFQSLENQRKRIFLCRTVGRGFRPTIGGSPPNPGAPYYADAECPRFALTGGAPRRFCPKSGGKTRSRFHRKPSGCGESHWRRKLRLMRLKSAQRSASKITPFIFSARSRKGRRVHEYTSAPPAITSAPPAHQNFFKKARLPFL